MIKLICTLLLVIFSSTSFAQGKILLQEDFKNNEKGWRVQHDTDFLVEIKNGSLHLEKFHKNFVRRGCLWYNRIVPGLNTLENFSIVIYAKFLSGGDIFEVIDFQWGERGKYVNGKSTSSLYQLDFFIQGEAQLSYFNSKWTYFIRKSINELLEAKNFNAKKVNKYEIVQKDGFIIVSINDKEVFKQLCTPIKGNSIGFQQCLKSAWEIDKIVVRQLPDTKPIIIDSTQLITNAIKADITPADKELKVYPNPFINNLSATINLEKDETVKIYLSDIKGVVLQQHTILLQKGLQTIPLYADVTPGSYVLKVQVGNAKVLSTTIIKQ